MKLPVLLLLAASLGGCAASGYRQHYEPHQPPPADARYLGENEAPLVVRVAPDAYADTVQRYRSRGHAVLGSATFSGRAEPRRAALAQARRVRATVVVLTSRYSGTATEIVPLHVPGTDLVPVHGVATIEGRRVPVRSYQAIYTTHVVPMATQVHLYDHVAAFLVRREAVPPAGLELTALTPPLRRLHERNSGAVVDVVHEDSPAFRADVLEGDLIVAVDGEPVASVAAAEAALAAAARRGGPLTLRLIREKAVRELTLTP